MQLFLNNTESSWYSFIESEGFLLDALPNKSLRQIHICYFEREFEEQIGGVYSRGDIIIAPKTIIKSKYKVKSKKIYNKFSSVDYSYVIDSINTNVNLSYIDEFDYGNGKIYSFDDHLDKKWGCSSQINREIFIDSKTYFEKLCAVDKRNLRAYMRKILKLATNSLEIPLIYIWKYPKLASNVFNLRIDVDPERTQPEVSAIKRIEKTFEMSYPWIDSITFAINFYRRQPKYNFFKKYMDFGFDIQSHNFFHLHFPSSFLNRLNIKKAHQIITDNGIEPTGFISPEYFWHNEISDIIEHYNYKFAGSFGFDYSNYPYRPFIDGKIRKYFEISSDPMVYSKILQNHNPKEILSVYKSSIASSLKDISTPCFKYEHPAVLGGNNDIYRTIVAEGIKDSDVLPVKLSYFAKWLEARNSLRKNVKFRGDSNSTSLRIFKEDGFDLSEFSIAYEKPYLNEVHLFDLKESLKNGFDLSVEKSAKIYKFSEQLNSQSKYNKKTLQINRYGLNTHSRKILQGMNLLLKYRLNNFYL